MPELYKVHINGIPSSLTTVAAVSFRQRIKGYIGKTIEQESILFPSCRAVHTFFMSFPLDIFFLDKSSRVVRVCRAVKPGKLLWPVPGGESVLEIPSAANRWTELSEGARLSFSKLDS